MKNGFLIRSPGVWAGFLEILTALPCAYHHSLKAGPLSIREGVKKDSGMQRLLFRWGKRDAAGSPAAFWLFPRLCLLTSHRNGASQPCFGSSGRRPGLRPSNASASEKGNDNDMIAVVTVVPSVFAVQVAAPLFVPGAAPSAPAPRAAPHAAEAPSASSSGLSALTVGTVASAGGRARERSRETERERESMT